MPRQIEGSQTDFSFGEVDVTLKRADQHPAHKGGLRQMKNARILNSGSIQDRSGRTALFPISSGLTRIEEFNFLGAGGGIFKIGFGPGVLSIINSVGAVVASFTTQGAGGPALPWTGANTGQIVYSIVQRPFQITVCFGFSMRPLVVSFTAAAGWTIVPYTEAVLGSGQKRTPFFRLSPQNVTMQPSATSGVVTITFSAPILQAGHVGTRMRFCERQILITAVASPISGTAAVIESLPAGVTIATSGETGSFSIGDEIIGATSGATAIVTGSSGTETVEFVLNPLTRSAFVPGVTITGQTSGAVGVITNASEAGNGTWSPTVTLQGGGAIFELGETVIGGGISSAVQTVAANSTLTAQLLPDATTGIAVNFGAEVIAGPSGSATATSTTIIAPQPVSVWDDEVMNSFRGFPASCFVDQFRQGFCNFPSVPNGIAWSAINSFTDLYVGAISDEAIFENVPGASQVLYVVPGPEGSEFVFCNNAIYYIPISTTSPLAPGTVGFTLLSGDGAAQVQPRLAQQAILYANAGQNGINAVIATGSITQPFNTVMLSKFHQHLFSNIQAIAAPNADGTFLERYAYVLNGNGSITVGKYQPESLLGNLPVVGWGPWSGAATVSWIAAFNADVIFTSSYFGVGICEILDDTQFLDSAFSVNSPPAAFTAAKPAGMGPLWFVAGQTVTLMDQVTRVMGTYQVNAAGNIVPQFNGGENLEIASLVAGQPWVMTVEPFEPISQPGQAMNQRLTLRQIGLMGIYVVNSTGFMFVSLFSRKQTPTSPPLGTQEQFRRFPAFNQGDNPTLPPPLRETVQTWTPPGSSYDPRVAIVKDVPGPLQILEIATEVTI
jgi:hypothetical protein